MDQLGIVTLLGVVAAAVAAFVISAGLQRRGARRALLAPPAAPGGAADRADRAAGAPGAGARDVDTAPAEAGRDRTTAARAGAVRDAIAAASGELAIVSELVGVGLVRVEPDLTVSSANDVAHRLMSRRGGGMIGRSLIEATADHRIEDLARAALADGSASGECTVRTAAAPTILIRARRLTGGGAWLAFEDVSELRRLQRIRSEFIDNLSHELRTPLTTVALLAETLARDAAALPPKAAQRVTRIEVETGHLVQMVNELLELSRIEGGRAPLAVHPVDVGRLVATTSDRLVLFAERQGVRIHVDPGPPGSMVRGDAERLGQALLNLLHNAVKFSPPGSAVEVTVGPAEHEVIVAVTDHGQGIPRAALPRVFERFYKVDRSRTGGGGTGLGLSIARHIVEAHGGRIWADSQEGVGSTFAFAIPFSGPTLAATPGA